MLFSYLRVGIPSDLFLLGFSVQHLVSLYAILIFPMRATWNSINSVFRKEHRPKIRPNILLILKASLLITSSFNASRILFIFPSILCTYISLKLLPSLNAGVLPFGCPVENVAHS
jgi:hypothetical protein